MLDFMQSHRARYLLTAFLGALLTLLISSGCGFHPRSWDLEGNVASAKITANQRNPLAEPLGRALRSAGVTIVESGEADLLVELLADRQNRRSISVTDQARAAEYETTLSVQYAVHDKDGNTLSAPRWVRASRTYEVDRNNLVGSSEEQSLLEREMVTDLVQQLIRGINAVVREPGSAT